MANEKSLVEEAIIQMKNLEEAVAENAKGILASTMKQEIKDLVKESLSEQEDDEIGNPDVDMEEPETDDIADIEDMDDEEDDDDFDMDTDNDDESDDEEDMDFDDEEDMDFDDEDTIDLTNADDDEVLKVFQLMGPDDNIVVTKDDIGNTHLKDEETGKEYMIVGEGEEGENLEMYDMDEDTYEDGDIGESIESIVDRMFGSDEEGDEYEEENEEIVYEIQMEEDDSEDYSLEEEDDADADADLYESKMSIKPKGVGMGNASKFKYPAKPNQGTGFKTKMKEAPKSVGTGKAKFEYKEGENAGSKLGKMSPVKKTVAKTSPTKKVEGKKEETKEAVRTLGAGSNFRKGGLPKSRAHSQFNSAIKESATTQELNTLRSKNEEYRKALDIFRNKLTEVAVFNSNLAYATRLFTEQSTSKQEKINILRRFDGVDSIKESKNLYRIIKDELSSTSTGKSMNESIERTIAKAPSTGSAINLIESKTYENPQFLRMKDLMTKIK